MKIVLGLDVGSVSTKIVALDDKGKVINSVYLETDGDPTSAIQKCLRKLKKKMPENIKIIGMGCTGSSRKLIKILVGADLVIDEITSHVIGALNYYPNAKTLIQIGGQDSSIVILKNKIPVWNNVNSICSAGTGSFLSHQAFRLKIPIEKFGDYALKSTKNVTLNCRCGIFAESDMINKAALGYAKEDIIKGLCEGLVRNFINNVAGNKRLKSPVVFSGGVASNIGVVSAFKKELNVEVVVPKEHKILNCIGVALLVLKDKPKKTNFKGFEIVNYDIKTKTRTCSDCPNRCKLTDIFIEDKRIGTIGSKCGKWNI